MRLFGSFNNRVMESGSAAVAPVVGMGVTVILYSDRHAATITEVVGNAKHEPRTVTVQYDNAIRTDSYGMSDSQDYRYEADLNGRVEVYTLRRNGRWVRRGEGSKSGTSIALDVRDHHHDFGF